VVAHRYAPSRGHFPLKIAVASVVAVVLAAALLIQVASDGLLQAGAATPSVPRAVPQDSAVQIYQWLTSLPFSPAFVRSVVAQSDIDSGHFGAAEQLTASLPPGSRRADLEGELSAHRGDQRMAVARFIEAGDSPRVNEYVDRLVQAGRAQEALRVQKLLVDRVSRLNDQGRIAQADWRLAQIESATGDHRNALLDYEAALRIIPLSETYLLGAANEALEYGSVRAAGDYFASVVRLDPTSLDGHVGVGRVAARMGNVVLAQHELQLVREEDPQYRDIPVLEREIANADRRRQP